MDLTNVNGVAIIGPGSEWFWAAASGLVLAITFLAIYRCRWWWAVLAPYTRRLRIETGDRQRKEHLEWLAGVMAELDRKAGVDIRYDDAFIAKRLDSVIENFQDRIRVAEELRATVLRPMTTEALPPPPEALLRRRPSARRSENTSV